MNKLKWIVLSAVIILAVGFCYIPTKHVSAAVNVGQNNKYDGDCTGYETVGRCADKPITVQPAIVDLPPSDVSGLK